MKGKVLLLMFFFISSLLYSAVWPVKPQDVGHKIEHSYGDYEGEFGFHDGIDIPVPAGTQVYACITGVVRKVVVVSNMDDTLALKYNVVEICTSIPDTNHFWAYGHIYDIDTTYRWALRDSTDATVIPTTDFVIGRVCTWTGVGGPTDHLHLEAKYERINPIHPFDSTGFIDALLGGGIRPFPCMEPCIDFISFRRDRSSSRDDDFTGIAGTGGIVLYGDVDIIVSAHTDIEGDDKSGVNSILYRVFDDEGKEVIPGKKLMDFKCMTVDEARSLAYQSLVYDSAYRTTDNYYTAQGNPYIVTNVERGETRTGGIHAEEQCWSTWAKIGQDGTVAGLRARINGEALFEDGEYKVVVEAWDFADHSADSSATVLLDNFLPYLDIVNVVQEGVKYCGHWGEVKNDSTLGDIEKEVDEEVDITKPFEIVLMFSEVMDTTKVPEVKVEVEEVGVTLSPSGKEWVSPTQLDLAFDGSEEGTVETEAVIVVSNAYDLAG